MGRFMHCFYPDYQLRFFIKEGTVWPAIIHADPIIQGRIDKLPRTDENLAFIHLADDSIVSRVDKINQYTENEIEKSVIATMGLLHSFTVHLFVSLELISRKVVSVMAWRVSSVLVTKVSTSLLL